MKMSRIRLGGLTAKIASKKARASAAFLITKRTLIKDFKSLDDLAVALDEVETLKNSGIEHHFSVLRYGIATQLWKKGVLLGMSVVEALLFDSLTDDSVTDLIQDVLKRIKDFGLHRNGFILYPLHSFGIMGMGFGEFITRKRLFFADKTAGVVIFPQSNSKEVFLESLKTGVSALRICKRLPQDALEHFLRQGVLNWITRNPILLVRASAFSGSYYDNQFLLLVRLQFVSTYVMMLSSFQKEVEQADVGRFLSTSQLNNWETLDIKHYLVFQTSVRTHSNLEARRVPMNVSAVQLAELAELNVELDPRQLSSQKSLKQEIRQALATAETGYFEHGLLNAQKPVKARVFRKLFLCLSYFRKSFRETSAKEDAIVNLAVAFETLLTDHYSHGVTERITRRSGLALKGVRGMRKMKSQVVILYQSRGSSVHQGLCTKMPDLRVCRQAFIHCFVSICRKVSRLKADSKEPIREMLGDRRE